MRTGVCVCVFLLVCRVHAKLQRALIYTLAVSEAYINICRNGIIKYQRAFNGSRLFNEFLSLISR